MDDPDIRWKIVRRMWNDDVRKPVRCADIDSVVDLAVPTSDEGRARELLTREMIDDGDCPVVWSIAGQAVTLRTDKKTVATYIEKYGGEEAVPWDLKSITTDKDTAEEVTETHQ